VQIWDHCAGRRGNHLRAVFVATAMDTKGPTRIVVLGGGFAGLSAVAELERLESRAQPLEITLVNRDNFSLFTPMLHEVAASDLDLTHIVNPIRKLTRRAALLVGEIERIELERRTVLVSHGESAHGHEVEYDQLVLALGGTTNFYGVPGVAERALTMKTLGDAIRLRNRLIAHLEQADAECFCDFRESLLTFVVAGAGFAGVETAAAVNDFAHGALKYYPNLKPADIRIVLVHAGHVVLPELAEGLGRYAQAKLGARGVEIVLRTTVTSYDGDVVQLSDGRSVPARTLVWTAGSAAHPLVSRLPCPSSGGRIVADEYFRVADWPGVWAVGDCAAIRDPATDRPYPPTAQHAVRQGRLLARNLVAALRGESLKPFRFATLGQLAAIGRRTGVANVFGFNFSGFAAWFLWRSIYLGKLPRLEKKLRVMLDWTLDLLFDKDMVQFETRGETTVMNDALPVPAPAAAGAAVADTSRIAQPA
jgi:NADH:ubiquinone reductase (H+-translocating)